MRRAVAAVVAGVAAACDGGASLPPDAGEYVVQVRLEAPGVDPALVPPPGARWPEAWLAAEADEDGAELVERAAFDETLGVHVLRFPDGERLLRAGSHWLVDPPATVLFAAPSAVRPGVAAAEAGTGLRLRGDGLAPWADGDTLTVLAPVAGVARAIFDEDGLPAPGGAACDVTLAWAGFGVVDAAAGDETFVVQRRVEALPGGALLWRAVAAAPAPGLSMAQGVLSELDVTLAPVVDVAHALDVRRADFIAAGEAVMPTLNWVPWDVQIVPSFAGVVADEGDQGFVARVTAPGGGVLAGDFAWGDPFPPGERWLLHEAFSRANYRLPGTSETLNGQVRVAVRVPLAEAEAGPVVPLVGPPRAVSVAGVAHGPDAAPLAGTGNTPVIAWDAPELGTPVAYELVVYRLVKAPPYTIDANVGRVFTRGTSVRLPPGLVDDTSTHYVIVRAWVGDELSPADRPRWNAGRLGLADAITGPFVAREQRRR